MLTEFGKALDEGKEIRVVFCDISKAFDRVWHIGLLKKIKSIGIQGSYNTNKVILVYNFLHYMVSPF
jgi:hypothetical protein